MPRALPLVLGAGLGVAVLTGCTAEPTPSTSTAPPVAQTTAAPTVPAELAVSVSSAETVLAQLSSQRGTASTPSIGPIDGQSVAITVACAGPAPITVQVGESAVITRDCDTAGPELRDVVEVYGGEAFAVTGSAEDATIWALAVTLP